VQAETTLGTLEKIQALQKASEHGWVLDPGAELKSLRVLSRRGLVETADRETRAELSAWEGRPVRWAARVSAAGHDLLAYARSRPAPTRPTPARGVTPVELLPSQMTALRVFVGLADQLTTPPAQGLAEQVRTAVHDRGAGRWRLMLTQEQMQSVAYGFWLHRLTGSAAESNRFERDYGIVHIPETDASAARTRTPDTSTAATPS
jgi:hypothetical protein